jgi:pimeloyl-ACP methyl ester carboxylesterase
MWTELFGLSVVGVPLAVLGAIYWFQDRILYLPQFPPGSQGPPEHTPAALGLQYEDINLRTPDGATLHGWFVPVRGATSTVVYSHGNAGAIGNRIFLVKLLLDHVPQTNLVMWDYRGYGLSKGTPTEKALEVDADTLFQFVRQHPSMKDTRIVLYGQSLGGGVACYLAHKYGAHIGGLVLENTFLSVPQMVGVVFPLLKPLSFLATNIWPNGERVAKLGEHNFPVLFLAGKQDEIIPHEQMLKLFEACAVPQHRKHLVVFEQGDHNSMPIIEGFWHHIAEWMESHVVPDRKTPRDRMRVDVD